MTLTERFSGLAPEKKQAFMAVKDEAALDAFLSEAGVTLTADEKKQALEYVTTGTLPLSDDDLDSVAGGSDTKTGESVARTCSECGSSLMGLSCPVCSSRQR